MKLYTGHIAGSPALGILFTWNLATGAGITIMLGRHKFYAVVIRRSPTIDALPSSRAARRRAERGVKRAGAWTGKKGSGHAHRDALGRAIR